MTRGRGHHSSCGTNGNNDNDRNHCRRATQGAGARQEDLHEWVPRACGEGILDVAETEQERQEHPEAERTIDQDTQENGPRYNHGGILDLFGHLVNKKVISRTSRPWISGGIGIEGHKCDSRGQRRRLQQRRRRCQ